MTAATFDTLKFVRRLEEAGIPTKQAEAMVEMHKEALAESAALLLATKEDITNLKGDITRDITDLKRALTQDITDFKKAIAQDITDLKKDITRLEQRITVIEGDVRLLKWMLSLLLAGMMAVLVRLFA